MTPAGYAHMTHALSALADGKVVIALEVKCSISAKLAVCLINACPACLICTPPSLSTFTLHLHSPPSLSTFTLHLHSPLHSPPPLSTSTLHLHSPPPLSISTLHLHPPPSLFAYTPTFFHVIHFLLFLTHSLYHFYSHAYSLTTCPLVTTLHPNNPSLSRVATI